MVVDGAVGSVAGVVLGAGSSRRMGRNKLLLELEGQVLVRRTVDRSVAAGLDPVLLVLGFESERVQAAVAGLPCLTVFNPDHTRGINTSLRLGIASVPRAARAAGVLLGDMPFVTADMIRALVECHERDGAPLVVSRYGEVTAPPTLYAASLFGDFARLEGDGCGRQVVRRHWHEAAFVSWPEAALADLDHPEDYERMRTPLEAG